MPLSYDGTGHPTIGQSTRRSRGNRTDLAIGEIRWRGRRIERSRDREAAGRILQRDPVDKQAMHFEGHDQSWRFSFLDSLAPIPLPNPDVSLAARLTMLAREWGQGNENSHFQLDRVPLNDKMPDTLVIKR